MVNNVDFDVLAQGYERDGDPGTPVRPVVGKADPVDNGNAGGRHEEDSADKERAEDFGK